MEWMTKKKIHSIDDVNRADGGVVFQVAQALSTPFYKEQMTAQARKIFPTIQYHVSNFDTGVPPLR